MRGRGRRVLEDALDRVDAAGDEIHAERRRRSLACLGEQHADDSLDHRREWLVRVRRIDELLERRPGLQLNDVELVAMLSVVPKSERRRAGRHRGRHFERVVEADDLDVRYASLAGRRRDDEREAKELSKTHGRRRVKSFRSIDSPIAL